MQVALTQEGWGVILHFSNGASVRAQIYEYARKRYHAFMHRETQYRKTSSPPPPPPPSHRTHHSLNP